MWFLTRGYDLLDNCSGLYGPRFLTVDHRHSLVVFFSGVVLPLQRY